jgi:BirA family transcriptional regulator, biotin operon repressor / biotin---[acetyl-CoA-carboxylase] ligase
VPGRITAALADYAPPPAPEPFAWRVLERLDHWCELRARRGFAPVRAAFLAHAAAAGTALTLHLGERRLGGEFAGLGDDGSLLLRTAGRVHAFAAGEVTTEAEN